MIRKGLGKGMGSGYYNLVPMDSHIHSLSAKGVKSVVQYKKTKSGKRVRIGTNVDGTKNYLFLNAKTLKDVPPSERYKVGKEIMGWDEYEIGEAEIRYRLENWKDAGYDKKPTEEEVRNDVYEDSDIYTWAWDDLMENLKESMQKKNPNAYWRVEVKNFGWRSLEGMSPPFYTEDPEELLRKVLPDTQNTFKIFNYGKGFAIQNWHHDSPMGKEWYYIVPISDTEYEQLREEGW